MAKFGTPLIASGITISISIVFWKFAEKFGMLTDNSSFVHGFGQTIYLLLFLIYIVSSCFVFGVYSQKIGAVMLFTLPIIPILEKMYLKGKSKGKIISNKQIKRTE